MYSYLGVLLATASLCLCQTPANWSALQSDFTDAFTAQRDMSINIPIDQLSYLGLSLNRVLFDTQGYTQSSLDTFTNLLDLKVGYYVLDVYWNEFTQKWQLCPAPIPANDTFDLASEAEIHWANQTYRCSPGFTISDVLNTLNTYFISSNVRVSANIVQIGLNLKAISFDEPTSVSVHNSTNSTWLSTSTQTSFPTEYSSYPSGYLALGNSTLADSIGAINSSLFTPYELSQYSAESNDFYDSGFPTQSEFLFELYRRSVVLVLSEDLPSTSRGYNISNEDRNTFFFPGENATTPLVEYPGNSTLLHRLSQNISDSSITSVLSEVTDNTHFRSYIDNLAVPLSSNGVKDFLQKGFSPVLNLSRYSIGLDSIAGNITSNDTDSVLVLMNQFIPSSFWSWARGQPTHNSANSTLLDAEGAEMEDSDMEDEEGWYYASNSRTAYSCVSMTTNGWQMQNCYDKIRSACQSTDDPFLWTLSSETSTYIDIDTSSVCPDGYVVGVPQSSMEQLALITFLKNNNVRYPTWIDVNDITFPGCYVSGGPYSLCPYKEVVTTRNLIKNIAPSAVVAFVLLVLMFCESFFLTTPIHTNRKKVWAKKVSDFYRDNDHEGVPS